MAARTLAICVIQCLLGERIRVTIGSLAFVLADVSDRRECLGGRIR
jgi:hypothetical protein